MKKQKTKASTLISTLIFNFTFSSILSKEVKSKNGMVVSAHPIASKFGLEILKSGGNAVDAAVGTALIIGVVEPHASGLGGGGGMLIYLHDLDSLTYINYYARAPRLVATTFFSPIEGQVFIIPEANKLADYNQERRIPVPKGVDKEFDNLNRCYPGNLNGLPMEKAAYEITQLIKKQNINLLLDLHESPVFHLEEINITEEYHGLGQTLIYTPNEQAAWLGMIVIDYLNSKIPPGKKQFSMVENPIKHSAAWSAGVNFNIPGFTVETCKKLPLEERVLYQLEVVNVLLKEKGIY